MAGPESSRRSESKTLVGPPVPDRQRFIILLTDGKEDSDPEKKPKDFNGQKKPKLESGTHGSSRSDDWLSRYAGFL